MARKIVFLVKCGTEQDIRIVDTTTSFKIEVYIEGGPGGAGGWDANDSEDEYPRTVLGFDKAKAKVGVYLQHHNSTDYLEECDLDDLCEVA